MLGGFDILWNIYYNLSRIYVDMKDSANSEYYLNQMLKANKNPKSKVKYLLVQSTYHANIKSDYSLALKTAEEASQIALKMDNERELYIETLKSMIEYCKYLKEYEAAVSYLRIQYDQCIVLYGKATAKDLNYDFELFDQYAETHNRIVEIEHRLTLSADSMERRDLFETYQELAESYFAVFDYSASKLFYEKLLLFVPLSDYVSDENELCSLYLVIGQVYFELKEYEQCCFYLKECISRTSDQSVKLKALCDLGETIFYTMNTDYSEWESVNNQSQALIGHVSSESIDLLNINILCNFYLLKKKQKHIEEMKSYGSIVQEKEVELFLKSNSDDSLYLLDSTFDYFKGRKASKSASSFVNNIPIVSATKKAKGIAR
jgi:tetratricopeptide (TPR) repeat protein